jgi:hypothetical protein
LAVRTDKTLGEDLRRQLFIVVFFDSLKERAENTSLHGRFF